jgi:hypothetical protein
MVVIQQLHGDRKDLLCNVIEALSSTFPGLSEAFGPIFPGARGPSVAGEWLGLQKGGLCLLFTFTPFLIPEVDRNSKCRRPMLM